MSGTPREDASPPQLAPLYDVGGDPTRSQALVRPEPTVPVVSDAAIGSATSKLNDLVETKFSNLRVAFRELDKDKSGKLTHDEVVSAVAGKWDMSERDREAVREVLKRSDKDGDGLINYGEFASGLTLQSQQDKDLFRMDNLPQECPSAKYRPRIRPLINETDVQPRASLTPRESSYGLKGPPSPRHGPRVGSQYASLAGGATPRPRFMPPSKPKRYGTSLNLPSMMLTSSDPTNMLSERANTPRAPPNDEVRPPVRPKFLNPKFLDPPEEMSPRSIRQLSEEMQGHLSGLVFAREAVAAEEPATREVPVYDQPRLSNGDSMRDHSPVKEGMPAQPAYKLDGKLLNAPPPPPDASKGKYNMKKHEAKHTGRFAWSSERIAHELVCKFDHFTRRREDHLNKLMWAVASDPNFDGIGCGTKGGRHPVPAKNDANVRVTPGNFPRICHRFGLSCSEKEAAEIFHRHNLPADGSVNMYTLAKQMRALSEGKDTGQMLRECENAIFGTPAPRPVTPKVERDPYRLAKLPQASWSEHSREGGALHVGPKAAGCASPRGSASTALW